MVDCYKAAQRAYTERKPTKTPKKETEAALCEHPEASMYDAEPDTGVSPSQAEGGTETSSAAGGRGLGRPVSASSCAVPSSLQASSPGGPAHASSPNLTLSKSKGVVGLARAQQAAGLGLQLWSCGKNMDKLHHTVCPSVATWLTFKRQGQIRIAVPLGVGMTGRGQEWVFSFLIWV